MIDVLQMAPKAAVVLDSATNSKVAFGSCAGAGDEPTASDEVLANAGRHSLTGDIGVGRGNHNIGTRDAKDVRNDHVKGVDSDAACIAADRARLLVDDYHYLIKGQDDRLVRLPGDGKRLAVDDQIGDHRATADYWASRRADSHGAGPKEVGCYGIAAGGQADIGDRGF